MKISAFLLLCVVGGIASECDVTKYKKIGCFKRDEANLQEQIFDKTDETFDLSNYQSKLPELVCECFQQTKDKFRYFAVGKNGHCFAGGEFQEKTEQSSECVGPAEHQQGGLESAEYVYQIKADAATPKDGGASEFGEWGVCSASCGGGKKSRERACVDPLPNDPGKGCEDLTEVEDCNTQPCPVDGGYGKWSEYSSCSKSCGPATKARSRQCDSPVPEHGGKACEGPAEQVEDCDMKLCVGESKTSVVCEGEKMELSCQPNWTLKVEYGNYGRTSNDVCTKWYNIHWSTECTSGESKVQSTCAGKESCEIDASNGVFGDPCRLTKKYLQVKYHCEGYDL